ARRSRCALRRRRGRKRTFSTPMRRRKVGWSRRGPAVRLKTGGMSPPSFIERPSPNFDARTTPIELVVLHYTGMQDAETALRRLTDPAPRAGAYPGPWQAADADPDAPLARVSTHYVVDEQGAIFRIVSEDARAWHAGVSSWSGRGDVNSR